MPAGIMYQAPVPVRSRRLKRVKKTGIVSLIKRTIIREQEPKYQDTLYTALNTGATGVSVTPTWTYISGIGQGDDLNNREGDLIRATSIDLRIAYNATAFVAFAGGILLTPMLRVLLVQDRENRGAIPNVNLLTHETDQYAPFGFMALPSANKRFRILMDKTITVSNVGAGGSSLATNQGAIQFRKLVKLKNMKIHYTGASSAITFAETNALFLYVISNGSTASLGVNVQADVRINWKDV